MNVVAFSIYGQHSKYLDGLLQNIPLVRQYYPGWAVGVWFDRDMDKTYLDMVRNKADFMFAGDKSLPSGMYWRTLVHDLTEVTRFVIRDADSRIGQREADAVAQWIDSKKALHVMRDHPNHSRNMEGGMWGLWKPFRREVCLRNAILDWYATKDRDQKWLDDSNFLSEVMFPMYAHDVLQHDCCGTVISANWEPRGLGFVGEYVYPDGTFHNTDRTNRAAAIRQKRDRQLMVVLNTSEEEQQCNDFLPLWSLSGCSVILSSPADKPCCIAGAGSLIIGRSYNRDDRSTWSNYQHRVLETMRAVVDMDYDSYAFTQYDSITFGPLPLPQSDECWSHIAGGRQEGFESDFFLHPPWLFGKSALRRFIDEADRHPITIENGVMDYWIANIITKANIKLINTAPDVSWSANSIDTPELVDSAKQAIHNGVAMVHGVKNTKQLSAIMP